MNFKNEDRQTKNVVAVVMYKDGHSYKEITETTGLSRGKISYLLSIYKKTDSLEEVKKVSSKSGPKSRRRLEEYKEDLVRLRKMNLDIKQIAHGLKKLHGIKVHPSTVKRYLQDLGEYKSLNRRTQDEIEEAEDRLFRYLASTDRDKKKSNSAYGIPAGGHGGLLFFSKFIKDRSYFKPLVAKLTDRQGDNKNFGAFLTLLGMKLIQKNKLSNVEDLDDAEDLKRFCGLNKIVSLGFLQKFINRINPKVLKELQMAEVKYLDDLNLISLDYVNLDYSATSFDGHSQQERHYVVKEKRTRKALLRCFAQDQESGFLVGAWGDISQQEKPELLFRLFSKWQNKNIHLPGLIVMDSKFLSYKKLKKLQELYDTGFLTLRKRGKRMIQQASEVPKSERKEIHAPRKFEKYMKYVIFSETKNIRNLGKVKQIVIYKDDKPYKFLITNKKNLAPKEGIVIYDKRWDIERNIGAQVDFGSLHRADTNNLIRADLDVTLNMLVYNLYKQLQLNLPVKTRFTPKEAYRKYIKIDANIFEEEETLQVVFPSNNRFIGLLKYIGEYDNPIEADWIYPGQIKFNIRP